MTLEQLLPTLLTGFSTSFGLSMLAYVIGLPVKGLFKIIFDKLPI